VRERDGGRKEREGWRKEMGKREDTQGGEGRNSVLSDTHTCVLHFFFKVEQKVAFEHNPPVLKRRSSTARPFFTADETGVAGDGQGQW
jgi:hypothetical protein